MTKPIARAFTLIELLIVIAIIAVLAGILMPMLTRAKESGLQTAAMSNMKQLGTAITLYTDENDGKLLPSTNYGIPETKPGRIWTTLLVNTVKDTKVFIAPGSGGAFAGSWGDRSLATIGYNSSTAIDRAQGCSEESADLSNCVAFKSVVGMDKLDASTVALFAVTPGGPLEQRYLGYEFSPYNGVPNPADIKMTAPLVSDRDLVKEFDGAIPAELLKPVYARYQSTGQDQGLTPVVFADGHANSYSARQIMAKDSKIQWRLR